MRDIGKLALRLFLFAFVAAAALGITNEVTKGPIEARGSGYGVPWLHL